MKLVKAPSAGRSRHSVAVCSTNGAQESRPRQLQSCAQEWLVPGPQNAVYQQKRGQTPQFSDRKKKNAGGWDDSAVKEALGCRADNPLSPQNQPAAVLIPSSITQNKCNFRFVLSSGWLTLEWTFQSKAHQSTCRTDVKSDRWVLMLMSLRCENLNRYRSIRNTLLKWTCWFLMQLFSSP